MGTVLNKDTKGIKVAVKAKHVTRKASEKAIRNDGGFAVVTVKNPKQLYDILDTADLYVINDAGKYFPLTMENALDSFEALNENKPLDTEKFKEVTDVAKTLGHCKLTSLLKVTPSAAEAKKFGELSVEDGVIHGNLYYFAEDVAESNTYKKGYFLAIGYDDVLANASGITEPKIIVNDKTATVIAGNNVIGLGEEYPKTLRLTGKVTVDTKEVVLSENLTLKVELLPKVADAKFKAFEEVPVYPVEKEEKKTESSSVAASPTPVAPGAAAVGATTFRAASVRGPKKTVIAEPAVMPPSSSEPEAAASAANTNPSGATAEMDHL